MKKTDVVEEEGRLVLPAVSPEDAGFCLDLLILFQGNVFVFFGFVDTFSM